MPPTPFEPVEAFRPAWAAPLPLCTDVIISEGMARRAAADLEQGGIRAFVLPALAYAPAGYAEEFAGTMNGRACLMRGHGITTCGKSVEEATLTAIKLSLL